MKSLKQIKEMWKSNCIDGRDVSRLAQFIPERQLKGFGLALQKEYKGKHKHLSFNRENILQQLEKDVAFGFEKALNKRGISSGLMFEVVRMWNWILEEGMEDWGENENYTMYGLPLFKATAVKYGFENPIGDDSGSENKYNSD